jgi:superfamily I DNA/RNA helicase
LASCIFEVKATRRWYEPHLERLHEDVVTRRADLIQLEQIASGYPSRERFLTELTLDPPDATSDQSGLPLLDEDYLILSTIHSAKGQERKSVFVLNVVDGCIPSDLGTGWGSLSFIRSFRRREAAEDGAIAAAAGKISARQRENALDRVGQS